MSVISKVCRFEEGLKTLLDLCETLFGHFGQPVFLRLPENPDVGGQCRLSTDSGKIFEFINRTTSNPLVKIITSFGLDQNKYYRDHSLYLVIFALNIYLRLKQDDVSPASCASELLEMEKILEKTLTVQCSIHRSFDLNFENLVQLALSFCQTKFFGIGNAKLEIFCKFVISALLRSVPDPVSNESARWHQPSVLMLSLPYFDEYKTGDVYEGILVEFNISHKTLLFLQQILELRSFTHYERIYKEKHCVNIVIFHFDKTKLCNTVKEQIELNSEVSMAVEHFIERIENNFLTMLEKSNVALVLGDRALSSSLRTKIADSNIFYLSITEQALTRFQTVFDVTVIESMLIEDTESHVFTAGVPASKVYQDGLYLAFPIPLVITLVLYKSLDSFSNSDCEMAEFLWRTLSDLIFKFRHNDKMTKYVTTTCHGGGCTEFFLAGLILRHNQTQTITANFFHSKSAPGASLIKNAVGFSFLHLWKLVTRSVLNNESVKDDGLLNLCLNNSNCICSLQAIGTYDQIDDLTVAKHEAIKSALKLVRLLLNTDSIITN